MTTATMTRPKRAKATPKAAKATPDPPAAIRRAADLLKQVSDPTRLQVLILLSERERNVTELGAELGIQSQPALSHHLALLHHGRLIERRRQGKNNFYSLAETGKQLAKVAGGILGD